VRRRSRKESHRRSRWTVEWSCAWPTSYAAANSAAASAAIAGFLPLTAPGAPLTYPTCANILSCLTILPIWSYAPDRYKPLKSGAEIGSCLSSVLKSGVAEQDRANTAEVAGGGRRLEQPLLHLLEVHCFDRLDFGIPDGGHVLKEICCSLSAFAGWGS